MNKEQRDREKALDILYTNGVLGYDGPPLEHRLRTAAAWAFDDNRTLLAQTLLDAAEFVKKHPD